MSVFANGYEWENWSANWCRKCIHDTADFDQPDEGCPIILQMMLGETPREIIRKPGSDYTKTICTKWSDTVDCGPKPVRKVPGQLELEI